MVGWEHRDARKSFHPIWPIEQSCDAIAASQLDCRHPRAQFLDKGDDVFVGTGAVHEQNALLRQLGQPLIAQRFYDGPHRLPVCGDQGKVDQH